jgi:DNA-binding transcriptional MocR family regulator
VLVDDPCYPYVLAMLREHGVHALGVPRTASGPDVAALNTLASKSKPRLFITNTTFQNPTGSTTTVQTAHDILLAAHQHGFTIVEDDIFAELNVERGPSLASLDRLRKVVYIGSVSKTIGPSLRVGYVVANEELAAEIASMKNVMSLSSSELMEQIVLAILTGGRHRTHLERLRRRLSEAYGNVTRRFTDLNVQMDILGGGMFVWAKLPTMLDSAALLQLAKARGILLAPGEVFRPDGRATGHFRFNVAHANDNALFEFIQSLQGR